MAADQFSIRVAPVSGGAPPRAVVLSCPSAAVQKQVGPPPAAVSVEGQGRPRQACPQVRHVLTAPVFSCSHSPSPPPSLSLAAFLAAGPQVRQSSLRHWDFSMDPAKATYYGLFPRAWTTYEEPVPGVRLTCKQVPDPPNTYTNLLTCKFTRHKHAKAPWSARPDFPPFPRYPRPSPCGPLAPLSAPLGSGQVSPVVPGDYATSSLPAAVFVWTVENTSSEPLDVSMMFSFQNGDGGPNDAAGGPLGWRSAQPPASSSSSSAHHFFFAAPHASSHSLAALWPPFFRPLVGPR